MHSVAECVVRHGARWVGQMFHIFVYFPVCSVRRGEGVEMAPSYNTPSVLREGDGCMLLTGHFLRRLP